MIIGNCRPYKIDFRYNCAYRRNCTGRNACTYASMLKASRKNGVAVMASPPCDSTSNICNDAKASASVCCESGFLHCKSRWEHKVAEVFVGDRVLAGIAAFASPDTLRVISGECSRFVPLEQVVGIRVG